MSALADLEPELAAFPGTVSMWCGPLTGPAWSARAENERHYAASMMKVAVMIALWRAAETGRLDLDAPIVVHNQHPSAAPGGSRFSIRKLYDNDQILWSWLGEPVPLRRLATSMIVRSSNLATNLLLASLGPDAFEQVNEVWRLAGAQGAHTDRGIEDHQARLHGLTNEVTAAALGALFGALAAGRLASASGTQQMLGILLAQEVQDDFALGMPAGAGLALKNGWVGGVRHSAAVIYLPDRAPYVLAVCTTGEMPDEGSRALLGRIAAASRVLSRPWSAPSPPSTT